MRSRIVWVEPRGGGEVGGALAQFALPHEGDSQVAVGLPILGFESQRFRETNHCSVRLPLDE